MSLDLPSALALAKAAIADAARWPTNWCTEMTDEDMNFDGQAPYFRCWAADGRDGATIEVTLGSEDYDEALGDYIATMNAREPQLAEAVEALAQQLAEMTAARDEACDLAESIYDGSNARGFITNYTEPLRAVGATK